MIKFGFNSDQTIRRRVVQERLGDLEILECELSTAMTSPERAKEKVMDFMTISLAVHQQ